jgi:lysophospholipase L1-like esterase
MLGLSKNEVEIKDWCQGGLSSQTYQSFLAKHYKNWVKTRCDFILLQLGTNDVFPLLEQRYTLMDFKENMSSIIKNFKRFKGRRNKHSKILVASIPLFCDEDEILEKNRLIQEKINPAIREIAKREKAIFVENSSVLENRYDLYDPDGVHPNTEGERALARNWLSWIRRELRE